MNNKYKQFVKYNILNKKTSPFGWYENVYVFKIHCSRWITLSKEDFEITLRDIKINKILSTKECD